jgi:hypothetical protein
MVSNRTQNPPPLPATQLLYVLYFETLERGWGGELNQREGQKGNSSQIWFENTIMTECISSI